MTGGQKGYTQDWTIDELPVITAEIISRGDREVVSKLLDVDFFGNYFESRNQSTTFFLNRETEEKVKKAGSSKYMTKDFVENIIVMSRRVEKEIRKFLWPDLHLRDVSYLQLINILENYHRLCSQMIGLYRLTRPMVYQGVVDFLIRKLGRKKFHLLMETGDSINSGEVYNLISILKKAGHRRLEMHSLYIDVFKKSVIIFEEIGKRLGITALEAQNCMLDELIDALKKGSIASSKITLIRQRIEYYKLIESKIPILSSSDRENSTEVNFKNEIKGQPAYHGVVIGKINVVRESLQGLNEKDVRNFKEGSILLARTTPKEMMPAIKKSIAIISEVGGILCHAAIISRELKKPCVIGVKSATKILQDGDKVEVDGHKGLIRRLSNP